MQRFFKFSTLLIYLLFFVSCGGGGSGSGSTIPPSDPEPEPIPLPVPSNNPPLQNVLILYDTAGPYGEQGNINSLLLENLLGHFDINITSKPAEQYIANEIVDNNITTVFYLGTTFNVLSEYTAGSAKYNSYINFYQNIAENYKTVVWMNYNLDLLESEWEANTWGNSTFVDTTGFTSAVTDTNYNRVWYKDTELYKGVIPFKTPDVNTSTCYEESNTTYACALELNTILIFDEDNTHIHAEANSTFDLSIENEPYVTQGGNFWFVGDIPFTYMSEEDRYLAFADLLHDMLGIDHNVSHKAIMRLEDVNAETNPSDLVSIAEYMQSQNIPIPFNIATIPQYENPLNDPDYPAGPIKLFESDIGTLLQTYYDERLIDIVQHGFSHQYDSIKNPYNGVTADDFEFMIVTDVNNDGNYTYVGPSENDDGAWAKQRMLEGKMILETAGIQAFAWEAPHYMAGPNHYRAIKEIYPIQYSRLIYYPDESDKSKFVGQFYPYIIRKDTYGYYVIPENIHNIVDAPNEGYRTITSDDIIRFSQKLKVVRDGVASFYYHPYLGTGELSKIIPGLQDAGYTFVRATTLVE
jgi:uncharacterized protein YdaL